MFPRTGGQTVVTGQRIGQHTEIGRALNVIVAAEDIRAAAGYTHVAERQLECAVGAGIVVTDGVLGTTHAPDEGARTIVGHRLGSFVYLGFRHAGDTLDFCRVPFLDFLHHVVHAVNALTDEFLVLPVVFKDMPHHAPDDGNVGAGANLEVMVGVRRGAGITRIDDDHRRIVLFLGLEDMLQRNRVRFRGLEPISNIDLEKWMSL